MASEKRLIDANWILGEIEHDLGCYDIGKLAEDDVLYVDLRDIVKMVCAAPTVDAVEVVHGRWHTVARNGLDFIECSECHYGKPTAYRFRYCPNCGAKMDGERKDNERKAD